MTGLQHPANGLVPGCGDSRPTLSLELTLTNLTNTSLSGGSCPEAQLSTCSGYRLTVFLCWGIFMSVVTVVSQLVEEKECDPKHPGLAML
ncbi:hypothetical protein O3P69_014399 [Scylla paramamosain]|uniref:Uncharacterized protein n=1 Tax=Scylla paramamosain TaxID=85552 RepID=A0AAW0TDT1_SCYPA